MEVTVAVLYRQALAHYSVTMEEKGDYEASLLKYNGGPCAGPPRQLWFKKQGRHCTGNEPEQELMDDLYWGVLLRLAEEGGGSSGPVLNPNTPYVSI